MNLIFIILILRVLYFPATVTSSQNINCDDDDIIRSSQRFRRFLTTATTATTTTTTVEKEKNCTTPVEEVKFLDGTTTQFPEQKETTSSVSSIPGFLTSDFNETNYNTITTSSSTIPVKFNQITAINAHIKRNVSAPKSRIAADLKFLDVPPGGGMTVPDLLLDDDGYVIFGWIASIVSELQTADFPAALFKDWALDRLSFSQIIIQTVRVEGGIIACVIIFVISALMLPFAVLAHTSCRFGNDEDTPSSSSPSSTHEYRKLLLVVLLDLMIILFPLGVIGMFFSNEHLARSILNTKHVTKSMIDDTNTFIRNSHLQIRFVATTTMDQAIDATIADLEDVEDLLGRPIQKELATETGIDIALEALVDICSVSADIATDVLTLRAEAQAARETARASQDRLKDLRKQVDTARRQCIDRDRILCDTVDTVGLDVIFNVDKLLTERKLAKLRHLGEDNLTSAASDARKTYQNIPQRIISDTTVARQEIKNILRQHREKLYSASDALEEVSHDFLKSIDSANIYIRKTVESITSIEQWRWLIGLVSSLLMLIIWFLMITVAACIHANCSNKIFPLLVTLIVLICTISMLLWLLSSIVILAGGNGQLLLCEPLYDDPNFASLTLLLDNPGMMYKTGGLFTNILNGNDSLDVPLKVVLSECRLNQPVFPTFNLNRIFNVDYLTNHPRWPKLHTHIYNISASVNINDTEILSTTLQKYLQDISSASRVNLTYYRSQLSGSVTQTDLNTFADQLERIAGQIVDVQTQARMETLAARARKLLANNLQRLEKHRDEIVYKLTALELKLLPLQRQANQSLSHLKTIQFYVFNQGSHISEIKSKEYVARLIKYLEKFREHVIDELTYDVAPCRPLWDIFRAGRTQICRNIVEPLNGFWASTVWCLILFFILTPVLMSLIGVHHNMSPNGDVRRDLNELLITDQGPWTTPNSTPESIGSPEQSSWPSPSPRREPPLIPSITVTREESPPQTFRKLIGKRLNPRSRLHESLKMIEPSTSKSASSFSVPSPKGWL